MKRSIRPGALGRLGFAPAACALAFVLPSTAHGAEAKTADIPALRMSLAGPDTLQAGPATAPQRKSSSGAPVAAQVKSAAAPARPMEALLQGSYRGAPFGEPVPALLTEGQKPLLHLSMMLEALNFAVEVASDGTVSGTAYPSETDFAFLSDGSYHLDGRGAQLPAGDFLLYLDELYVSPEALALIAPVRLEIDARDQSFVMEATGPLAQDVAREREIARAQLGLRGSVDEVPLSAFPYRALGRPTGDVDLTFRQGTGARAETSFTYNGLFSSEIGYVTGLLFVTGNEDDALSDARLRFGRESPMGGAFGIPGVTSVYAGDVQPYRLPLIGGVGQARGVSIGAFPLERPDSFDQTVIEGDGPPNWDVELFRGNELIAFQRVGPDGRYLFENVPLLFGDNAFRVVFYGPDGQRREELRDFRIGGGMIEPGRLYWRAFAGEQNARLLSPVLPERNVNEAFGFSAEAALGLTQYLSASAFAARAPDSTSRDSRQRTSYGGGLRVALPSVYLESDHAWQEGGGEAWSVGGIAGFADVSLSARHAQYDDFRSANASYAGQPLQSDSTLRIATSLSVGGTQVGISADGRRREMENGTVERSALLQTRLSAGQFYITQGLDFWRSDDEGGPQSERLYYYPAVAMNLGDLRLSGSARYDLKGGRFGQLLVSGNYRFDPLTNAVFGVTRAPGINGGDAAYTVSGGLSRDFGPFFGSVNFSRDQNDDYMFGLRLSMSFGFDRYGGLALSSRPMAQHGTADILVYNDRDGDGHFNPDMDEPMPQARLAVNGLHSTQQETDETGYAFLTQLDTTRPVSVEIDPGSISDPFLAPADGGLRFLARPGQPMSGEIALVDTGEIAGRLVVERAKGVSGLSGVVIDLLEIGAPREPESGDVGVLFSSFLGTWWQADEDSPAEKPDYREGYDARVAELKSAAPQAPGFRLVATKRTNFDGDFLFDLVRPGTYVVRIAEGQFINGMPLEQAEQRISVARDGLMVDGVELRLMAPELTRNGTEYSQAALQGANMAFRVEQP